MRKLHPYRIKLSRFVLSGAVTVHCLLFSVSAQERSASLKATEVNLANITQTTIKRLNQGFQNYNIVSLDEASLKDLLNNKYRAASFHLDLTNGYSGNVDISLYDPRDPDFILTTQKEGGTIERTRDYPLNVYKGNLSDDPSTGVVISFGSDRTLGFINYTDQPDVYFEQLLAFDESAEANLYHLDYEIVRKLVIFGHAKKIEF